uniref:Phospholipase B-like n=1 Tax=Daphnia galeata TaxID=27404 RepID=A0A8J2RYY7_9CRUS|nr:unnamed protein product [Daphnia galeata]
MYKFLLGCLLVSLQLIICIQSVQLGQWPSESKTAYAVFDESNEEFVIVNHEPTRDKYVAGAKFANAINQTGWATFEVWTNGNFPDTVQSKAAGFLEGYLTHELIYFSYLNTLQDYCKGRDGYCSKLRTFLATNTKWVNKMYTKLRNTSPFWHQVGLFYEQMEGMATGWEKAAMNTGHSMGNYGLMWFNIFGDMEEFEQMFASQKAGKDWRLNKVGRRHMAASCSALIKVLPDGSDIYTSHVTWNGYESMIRILKKYSFEVHRTAADDSAVIPGHSMSFSSYPGLLYSGDDFSVISSGLVSMETTIGNNNVELFKYIKPTGQVLEGVRSMVANRLASNGKEWTEVFSRHNSGTYNNQWMIVDYKLFKPLKPLRDGLFWVLEQLPTLIESRDMTDVLRSQSFWPSYNSPYFTTIFNLSGVPALVEQYGDWFTYDKTPRALIFNRDQSKVTDMDSMIRMMRYNDYRNDPLSRCEKCEPKYSGENAISARNDLNPANGTYPFHALSHRSHGATDCKVTSHQLMTSLDFIAVGGPTFDSLPAFRWSESDFSNLSHIGHPDLWKFEPVQTKWTL